MDTLTTACLPLLPDGNDFGSKTPAAYANAEALPFMQNWVAPGQKPNEGGAAYVGRTDTALCFYVWLEDGSIYTTATENNQQLWTLGDAAEFFIKPGEDRPDYWEIHVSPNDLLMDIHLPGREAMRTGKFTWDHLIAADSASWKRVATYPTDGYWVVELRIPWTTFGYEQAPTPGTTWQYSVSRYNYTGDLEHVEHSAMSPITELNFHQYEHFVSVTF